jgi:hypothetical protein
MKRLELRAYFCETLIGWAMQVCPKGYVPSYIQSCLDFYDRGRIEGKKGENVGGKLGDVKHAP